MNQVEDLDAVAAQLARLGAPSVRGDSDEENVAKQPLKMRRVVISSEEEEETEVSESSNGKRRQRRVVSSSESSSDESGASSDEHSSEDDADLDDDIMIKQNALNATIAGELDKSLYVQHWCFKSCLPLFKQDLICTDVLFVPSHLRNIFGYSCQSFSTF